MFAHDRAWADIGKRPNIGIISDHGFETVGADHAGVFADNHIRERGIRPDLAAIANHGLTVQLGAGVDGHVLADGHLRIDKG